MLILHSSYDRSGVLSVSLRRAFSMQSQPFLFAYMAAKILTHLNLETRMPSHSTSLIDVSLSDMADFGDLVPVLFYT